jgi:hypothetical protein
LLEATVAHSTKALEVAKTTISEYGQDCSRLPADNMPSFNLRNILPMLSGLLNFSPHNRIDHCASNVHLATEGKHVPDTFHAAASREEP